MEDLKFLVARCWNYVQRFLDEFPVKLEALTITDILIGILGVISFVGTIVFAWTHINNVYVKFIRYFRWVYQSGHIKYVEAHYFNNHRNTKEGTTTRHYLAVTHSKLNNKAIIKFLEELNLYDKVKTSPSKKGGAVYVDTSWAFEQNCLLGLGYGETLAWDLDYKGLTKIHDDCELEAWHEAEVVKPFIKKAQKDIEREYKSPSTLKSSFPKGYLETWQPPSRRLG